MQHPLHPTGRPVDEFFGRRYLRSNELISIGLIPNRVTLNRLIRAGLFPAPLRLSPRVLLWDSTEIAVLIDRLAGERDSEKKPTAAAEAAAGKSMMMVDSYNSGDLDSRQHRSRSNARVT
jgi:predicted DNA-binding transcriptional regulator AlpA